MRRTRPKLAVGDTVAYRADRRTRRKVTGRYWDANYPSWRYRLNVEGLRKDLAACWAVVESELILVKAGRLTHWRER